MNKIKFYQFLIAGLILCNIVLLAFFFLGKKGKGKHKQPNEIIIERLDFSKEQAADYEALIVNHRQSVGQAAEKIKNLKTALYSNLSSEMQDSLAIDSIQSELSMAKASIEKTHYDHFLDIKKLCKAEQLPKFTELSKDMARIFAPHKGPKRGPKKRR